MVNKVIDGNHLFHKTFGIFAGYGNMDPGTVLSTKKEQGIFIRKVSTDLCSALNSLPKGGRLVFCVDSRSWRRDVEIENGGYKSGRVKDEEVDWTIFYDLLHKFGEQLSKMGFIYSETEGAEADDLLMFWSEKFLEIGENTVIISGDGDLIQMSRINENSNWISVWNNKSKNSTLFVPQFWNSWLEHDKPVSIFDVSDIIGSDKEDMRKFVKKVTVEEVDTKKYILNKMLIGDDGDSVPTVWDYLKNEKLVRFTKSKAESLLKIYEDSEWKDLSVMELFSNPDFLKWTASLVIKISKDVDKQENRDKAYKNLRRNIKLMWLNKAVIPSFVKEEALKSLEESIDKPQINVTVDRIKILDGTEWVTASDAPPGFDPFENFLNS
jgi:5'-3' exonuclease